MRADPPLFGLDGLGSFPGSVLTDASPKEFNRIGPSSEQGAADPLRPVPPHPNSGLKTYEFGFLRPSKGDRPSRASPRLFGLRKKVGERNFRGSRKKFLKEK